jgi:hypothetical protein
MLPDERRTGRGARATERRRIFFVAIALALVALPSELFAQELRGTVRDSATRQPVPGVVLIMLDASGVALGRNITNDRGEYRVSLSSAIQRVRFLRLGFRPRELPVPRVADHITQLDVAMVALASILEPVRVTDNSACPRRRDAVATFALLEHARAGLLALIVARETNPGSLIRLTFERWMDGTSDRILRQRVQRASTERSAVSFVAPLTPRELMFRGFMTNDGSRAVFAGPDADLLLDTAFARGYCFRLADAVRERAGQVGLAFFAPKREGGRVDIAGTLWVDTVARSLVDIEYRYVGLGRQVDALGPGGHISFRTMPSGLTLIDRWFIRMIQADEDTIRHASHDEIRQRPYYKEDGGELAHAEWPDRRWDGSLGTLRARVLTSSGMPGAGIPVSLADTPYGAVADGNGTFEISQLLPGPYRLAVIDDRLEPIHLDTIDTRVTFTARRDSIVQLTVNARTAEDLAVDLCKRDRLFTPGPSYWLIGRVLSADGQPVRGTTVRIFKKVGEQWTDAGFPMFRTGTDGTFALCQNLVPNSTIEIRARLEGTEPIDIMVELRNKLTVIPIRLP